MSNLLQQIDRDIRAAMGRIMDGTAEAGDYGRVADLAARRVEAMAPPQDYWASRAKDHELRDWVHRWAARP